MSAEEPAGCNEVLCSFDTWQEKIYESCIERIDNKSSLAPTKLLIKEVHIKPRV